MNIDSKTAAVLDRLKIDGAAARIADGQLDRKLYESVNKVLEALGGTWSRKLKVHVFEAGTDVGELVTGALAAGKVVTVREAQQALGWFPTPDALADLLVSMAGLERGDHVLEPSAGEGAIIRAIRRAYGGVKVTAVEIDVTRASKLQRIDDVRVVVGDFMLHAWVVDRYDAVIANFPFCKSGRGDHLDHLAHAFEMIKVGGTLTAVLPASVRFREDKRHRAARKLIEDNGELIDLPSGSFKSSGTNVETCVAKMLRV